MKRVKVNYKQVRNTTEEIKVLGTNLTVKKDIPYSDKIKCATELAMLSMVTDKKNRVVYRSASSLALTIWEIMKWYTNADVEKMTITEIQRLHDAIFDDEGGDKMLEYVNNSFVNVQEIYEDVCDYLKKVYVSSMTPNFLENLFSNERADEMISEANIINEQLLKALVEMNNNTNIREDTGIIDFVKSTGVSFAKKK